MNYYAKPFEDLISQFIKLPGIGPKSAQRLAFYILSLPQNEVKELSDALIEAKNKIKFCSKCFNLTIDDPCIICSDNLRDKTKLCVVAEPKDLIAIERSGQYTGLYHILGGVISPLDGISPNTLRIKELLTRIKNENIKEIIMALNPTVEGEATVIYLTKLISPIGIELTRIAYGLPAGSDLDYADEITIMRAVNDRVKIK